MKRASLQELHVTFHIFCNVANNSKQGLEMFTTVINTHTILHELQSHRSLAKINKYHLEMQVTACLSTAACETHVTKTQSYVRIFFSHTKSIQLHNNSTKC